MFKKLFVIFKFAFYIFVITSVLNKSGICCFDGLFNCCYPEVHPRRGTPRTLTREQKITLFREDYRQKTVRYNGVKMKGWEAQRKWMEEWENQYEELIFNKIFGDHAEFVTYGDQLIEVARWRKTGWCGGEWRLESYFNNSYDSPREEAIQAWLEGTIYVGTKEDDCLEDWYNTAQYRRRVEMVAALRKSDEKVVLQRKREEAEREKWKDYNGKSGTWKGLDYEYWYRQPTARAPAPDIMERLKKDDYNNKERLKKVAEERRAAQARAKHQAEHERTRLLNEERERAKQAERLNDPSYWKGSSRGDDADHQEKYKRGWRVPR